MCITYSTRIVQFRANRMRLLATCAARPWRNSCVVDPAVYAPKRIDGTVPQFLLIDFRSHVASDADARICCLGRRCVPNRLNPNRPSNATRPTTPGMTTRLSRLSSATIGMPTCPTMPTMRTISNTIMVRYVLPRKPTMTSTYTRIARIARIAPNRCLYPTSGALYISAKPSTQCSKHTRLLRLRS